MHVARQTPQELAIVAGTRWVAAICAAGVLITVYLAITRQEPKNLFLSGFFLLFILVMDARKTFTFDAMQRIVRWSGRRLFKAESGEIPFDDITSARKKRAPEMSDRTGSRFIASRSSRRVRRSPWHTPTMDNPTVTRRCAGRFSTL